jgi:hypothetical protein
MKPLPILASLAVLLLCGEFVPKAPAQDDPLAEYNRARAYRHFLNSQAPVKSISSYRSGSTWGYDTPLESGRFYRTPGYYYEYVSPYERETFEVPQYQGGVVIRRPILVSPPPPPVAVPLYRAPPPYLR